MSRLFFQKVLKNLKKDVSSVRIQYMKCGVFVSPKGTLSGTNAEKK
jgi:hypothetical protein